MSFDFDASDFMNLLSTKEIDVKEETTESMHDCLDDLARITIDIAPIDKGTLRRSENDEVFEENGEIIGEITFSATEDIGGRFNYAYWTHEMDYELGEQSESAPGTDGYSVGNKYVERPLKGESGKYMKWLTDGFIEGINK